MRTYLALLALVLSSANAVAVTIDFEPGWEASGFDVYVLAGGVVTPADPDPNPHNGSSVFGWCTGCDLGWPDSVTLSNLDNQTFDLLSLDVGGYDTQPEGFLVEVEGWYGTGGTVETSFTAGDTWNTYYLDSTWQGLSSVTITAYTFGIPAVDNINVNVVPIPAAVWLFGSALAGLGWLRRRQASQ